MIDSRIIRYPDFYIDNYDNVVYLRRDLNSALKDMNSLSKKITACLSVVMLGIHILFVAAGAAASCVSESCCCTGMMTSHHATSPVIDAASHGCCSSADTIPCNMNENQGADTQILILSSVEKDLKRLDGLMNLALDRPYSFQTKTGNSITHPLWFTTNRIPIYLQNLTLLC